MKKFCTIFFLATILGCTKKAEQQLQQNLIVQAMVNGQWKVTSFKRSGTDVTTDFASYKFQFHDNQTVDALNNGVLEKTGSWAADPAAQTISSMFNNAVNPLALLNGTWTVTNTTWTTVDANQTVGAETRLLHLDKQ
jgi:hypothetical protein